QEAIRCQQATACMEARLLAGLECIDLPEIVGGSQRGVTAQVHFAAGGEPAEVVAVILACSALDQERRFSVVHLDGDGLHPCMGSGSTQYADAGGIAPI